MSRTGTPEAEYGTGSLPSPWRSNPPASSDSIHVTGYERASGRVDHTASTE